MKKIFIAVFIILILTIMCMALMLFMKKDNNIKEYTITFNSNGGVAVAKITAKDGEKIKLPATIKEGYTFVGWMNDKNEIVADQIVVNDNINLKANWLKEDDDTIIISFDSNGGSKVDSIKYEIGTSLKLPDAPIKEGYRFATWKNKNEIPISDGALLSGEDFTLYAYWEKEPTEN